MEEEENLEEESKEEDAHEGVPSKLGTDVPFSSAKEEKESESKEEKESEEEEENEYFFIGETKLTTSPKFKPVKKSLEKMVTKEIIEEEFKDKVQKKDEEDEEVYVPKKDEETYNEVREEENVFEQGLSNDLYKEKNDRVYSEDNARKDKYAPTIMSSEFGNEEIKDRSIFNASLSEEMRESRKNKDTLN